MENNVFYIQIMNAKERYADTGNYARFIDRLNKTLDDMYRFKDDPDIAMLIDTANKILEDESIQHYVTYKYSRDRELHLSTFQDETLCKHDEKLKLNEYFKYDKIVKKSRLAGMIADYCCNGIDSVLDGLVKQEKYYVAYNLDGVEIARGESSTKLADKLRVSSQTVINTLYKYDDGVNLRSKIIIKKVLK